MKTKKAGGGIPCDVDEYIHKFPIETQKVLQQVRNAIKRAAPGQ